MKSKKSHHQTVHLNTFVIRLPICFIVSGYNLYSVQLPDELEIADDDDDDCGGFLVAFGLFDATFTIDI